MKIHIQKRDICWYVFFIVVFFSSSISGVNYTWQTPTTQEWADSNNWQSDGPPGFPSSFSDTASINAISSNPIIATSQIQSIDVNTLSFDGPTSKVTLGSDNFRGTINIGQSIAGNTFRPEITLVNGVLNFFPGFQGNVGTGICNCVFSAGTNFGQPNEIIFLPGSTGGSNIVVTQPISGQLQAGLTIKEDITLGAIQASNIRVDIDSGKSLTVDNSNSFIGSANGVRGIFGGGSFIKNDSDTFTINSVSGYTGGTTVNAGILDTKADSSLGTGQVTVADGAQLKLSFEGTVANSLVLNGVGDGNGALYIASDGNYDYNGPITLGSAATIGSSGSGVPFTFSNTDAITGPYNLTFACARDIDVTGKIALPTQKSIVKNGSGKLTLSGPNVYAGTTAINSGIVNCQSNSALGTSFVTVVNGAQLQLEGGISVLNNPLLQLTLSGAGGDGKGALFNVSGNNTCNAEILLAPSAPSVTIGSDADTLTVNKISAQGDQFTLFFVGDGNITVNGIIQQNKSGALAKSGSGTLTLAAANMYVGQTMLNAGKINLNASQGLSGSPLVMANSTILSLASGISASNNITINGNSTIDVSSGGTATLSGIISGGGGSLIKTGQNTLVLTNVNSFGGGTTLNDGTLSIASANNIGGAAAALSFAGGTLQATGNVTTSGAVSVVDDSELTTNSSMTTVLKGLLAGSDGKTLTLSGDGTNSLAQVAVNGSDVFTISGVIGANDEILGLTKTGTGTLILPDANTYTGGTFINEGRLSVNGEIREGVYVAPGATLGGTGTIYGGGLVDTGGTLSPGNSIGTITFDTSGGDLTLSSASITNIEISPTDASKIVVTGGGNAILQDGTVNVIQQAGVYPSSGQYTILEGSYTGLFNPIVTGGTLPFSLSYQPNFIYLLIGDAPPPPPPSSLIPTLGLSGNALALANYLNQNALSSTLSLFSGLTDAQITDAMNSISPSRNAFGPYIAAQTALSVNTMVAGHIDACRQETRDMKVVDCSVVPLKERTGRDTFTVWAQGFGEFARQKKDFQNPSVNFNGGGLLIGFDYKDEHKNLIGGAFGYGRTNFNEYCNVGCGNVNYGSLSIYGNVFVEDFYVAPALSVLFDGINNVRNIAVPNFSARASAHMSAWQLVPRVEIGYDAAFSWANIVPFTAVDAAIVWQQAYQESGATPFNAAVGAKSGALVRSETGVKAYETWEFEWGTFFLREKVSYVFEKPCDIGITSGSFVGMPGMFTVAAVNQNLNLCALSLDLLFVVGKERSVKIDLGYEGKFGPRYWSNQVVLTVGKSF